MTARGLSVARVRAAVRRRVGRRARAAYYRFGYHRTFPGHQRLERRVRASELAAGRGDVPREREHWDDQYAGGGWDFLAGIAEVAHYAVITGYAAHLRPGGSVLDVGCGDGVLHDRWLPHGYARYVGVDLSQVAVDRLTDRHLPDTTFVAADAESFVPEGTFDVVVLNESLTYFSDPVGTFARYLTFLAPAGVAIVSCHVQSPRAQALQRELVRRHGVLDSTLVEQGTSSWRVCVIAGPR